MQASADDDITVKNSSQYLHSNNESFANINLDFCFRRIEDGEKLCKDLILLVQERANIEKEYAKQMKTWSTKWNSIIEKGRENKSIFWKIHRKCMGKTLCDPLKTFYSNPFKSFKT